MVAGDTSRIGRTPLLLLALVLAALTLAACGGDDEGSSSGGGGGGGGGKDFDGVTLTYLGFGGSTDEAFADTIFAEFEEQTGARVVLDSPTDYKKVEAQVQSGNVQYDIVDGDPYVMDPQCGEQWEELGGVDRSGVDPAFETDSDCTLADYGYYQQIASNTDTFEAGSGPQDCADFFDTEAFPGKRAVWSYVEASAVMECAAIAAGADPKNPYPIDMDAAFAKIESIKDDLVLYDSSADAVDKMQNGDVDMALVTARMVAEAVNSEAPVEASQAWIGRFFGSFGIPKGSKNVEAATALLSFMAEPENNEKWLAESGGGVSNVTKPIALANGAGNLPEPDTIDEIATNVDWDWWAENDPEVVERFTALTTG